MELHLKNECISTVKCDFKHLGCDWLGHTLERTHHLKDCWYKKGQGFLTVQNQTIENLQCELNSLNNFVHSIYMSLNSQMQFTQYLNTSIQQNAQTSNTLSQDLSKLENEFDFKFSSLQSRLFNFSKKNKSNL